MAFFSLWWEQQNQDRKQQVRALVNSGQLEFINAGWSMNDEATTYYQSIIDQMTLGHQFVKKEFGVTPRVGWHIDPFGHTATQASLFADMGFDSFVFWRIDYQDHDQRLASKNTEFMWKSSTSRGQENEIFTALTYDWYGPPDEFCFDAVQCVNSSPIQHRKDLQEYDLDARAEEFAKYVRKVSKAYQGDDVFLMFGGDFRWEAADQWYDNIEILINYFEKPENYAKYKLKLFYSSPSIYTDTKFNYNTTWGLKNGDFMPYADNPHGYWSGYYTSRAAFKGFERYSNAHLQVCKHMEVMRDLKYKLIQTRSSANLLSEAMGIAQHHDAISGTAKQHVTDDYVKRLASGCAECDNVISETLNLMFFQNASHSNFVRCNYLNVSYCSVTETGSSFTSIVYNSMAQRRSEVLRVPVPHPNYQIHDESGQSVLSQIQPLSDETARAQYKTGIKSNSLFEILFEANVEGNSFKAYHFVQQSNLNNKVSSLHPIKEGVLENEWLKVKFDITSGLIKSLRNKISKKKTKVKQTWEYYESFASNDSNIQSSGAYVFRPKSAETVLVSDFAKAQVIRGTIADEVRQEFSAIASQTVRLYHKQPYVEIEYTLGPINVDDKIGKEYITKFASSLNSGKTFFTDANGREILKRVLNYRSDFAMNITEPVAGNYYPVNSRISIQDLSDDMQLVIVTDRSQGGSSLHSGQIELMVNRKTVSDDQKGVEEPLNEDIVIRGKYWIFFDSIERSTESHRLYSEKLQNPLASFFVNEQIATSKEALFNTQEELADNLHLITFQTMGENILLRIGHLFALEESSKYSVPQIVDLRKTFGVELIDELSLTGNQKLSEMHRLAWNDVSRDVKSSVVDGSIVRISPMEIRTYLVKPIHSKAEI